MSPGQSSKVAQYKYVYYRKYDRGRLATKPYNGRFTLNKIQYDCGWYDTDKGAAIAVDMQLIRLNRSPINVLSAMNNKTKK